MAHKLKLEARALVLHLGAPQTSINLEKANLLVEAGYGSVQKLRGATDEELLAIPGVGPVTVAQIREYIAALGG